MINLLYLLAAILSFSFPIHSFGKDNAAENLTLFRNSTNYDHILMVGFPDQSINRVETGISNYRRRGGYQSSTWSRRITSQIAEDYHLKKITEWPMTEVSVHCVVFEVPPTASVANTIEQLGKDSRVTIVQGMHQFKTQAGLTTDPYLKLQTNLRQMEISQAHNFTTGKNISIAMIDTGVDINHPDLSGQIIQNDNFATAISTDFLSDKHGTAVAGIMVARKDNGIGISGVSPDAKLIAYKACWPIQDDSIDAVCNSFTLALAINRAIQSGAKILNMSLAGPHDPLLELLLKKAVEKGMIIVAANSKEDSNFPASMRDAISVDKLAKIGERNQSQNHISAPGDKILTTLPHGTYDFISGSSLSAAEVSGIIALLMELKPDLRLPELKTILERSQMLSSKTSVHSISANSAVLTLCERTSCPDQNLGLAASKTKLAKAELD